MAGPGDPTAVVLTVTHATWDTVMVARQEIVDAIPEGRSTPEDLAYLDEVIAMLRLASTGPSRRKRSGRRPSPKPGQ